MDLGEMLQTAVVAARAAEVELQKRPSQIVQKTDSGIDLVSDIDQRAEAAIRRVLNDRCPTIGVLGEEGGGKPAVEEPYWVVDPLDGTTNFLHGFPWYSTSIALVQGEQTLVGVVNHPPMGRLFTAKKGGGAHCNGEPMMVSQRRRLEHCLLATGFPYDRKAQMDAYLFRYRQALMCSRGVRRAGSAALDLAMVACGLLDGYWEYNLSLWDVAAGRLLVEEACGKVSPCPGHELGLVSSPLASNGHIHQALEQMLSAGPEVLPRVCATVG